MQTSVPQTPCLTWRDAERHIRGGISGLMQQESLFELDGLVAGVDEAGRGPLAGPVVAAAVILDPDQHCRRSRRLQETDGCPPRGACGGYSSGELDVGPLVGRTHSRSTRSIFSRPPCCPCGARSSACRYCRMACRSMVIVCRIWLVRRGAPGGRGDCRRRRQDRIDQRCIHHRQDDA